MSIEPMRILGWDIGGVNTKAALVVDGTAHQVVTQPFELQKAPDDLDRRLVDMAQTVGGDRADAHAVTMTAELSQMFRTKRDGVRFVLNAVERAFPGAPIHVYSTDGTFVTCDVARSQPVAVAAANWAATAHVVASYHPDALLVDIGTTTTDLIPIAGGQVVARGRTDPQRLQTGELVYTGAVRTPVEAIVSDVPLGDGRARVSAEAFALAGDVHVWLGDLAEADYDAATPDGRPSTRSFAGERLARVVCADREMLDDDVITRIATAVAQAQVDTIGRAMREVVESRPSIAAAVVTGLGAFLGARAATAAGLEVIPLSEQLGPDGARSAPATAVALLLCERLQDRNVPSLQRRQDTVRATAGTVTVVKLGGSLLADAPQWRAAIAALVAAAASHRIVVVPGGGPFADAVRAADDRFRLSDDAAHWMAIAGMDQHAEMISAASQTLARVSSRVDAERALDQGRVAVVAPLQWLRTADPLPHSWDVTSDSIAAWIAGQFEASGLVVVKAAGATGPAIVDPAFETTLPRGLPWVLCSAWELAVQLATVEPSRR